MAFKPARINSSRTGASLIQLLIALGVAGVMFSLTASVYFVSKRGASNHSRSVLRSLAWNNALPLAEAGIDEGLAHLKSSNGLASDGWTYTGSACTKQCLMDGGYYFASITNSCGSVTIASTGYALWQDGLYVSRTIQVNADTSSDVFQSVGLAATSISLGGDFHADSYDSSNPLYSTPANIGAYDPKKNTTHGVVAVASPGTSFAMSGNSRILGYVTVPTWGIISASGSAAIGDKSIKKGIQAGHGSYTFTNTTPEVVVPGNLISAKPPSAGSVDGTAYNYVLNGNYKASSLDAGGITTTIYVQANSKLYVSGNVTISQVVFAPGATLDLYIGTPSLNFSPRVSAAVPTQFSVWATPTCTNMTVNAGTALVGFIYGPQISFKANGNAAIYGAITAKSFSCNGTFDIHYDCARTNNAAGAGRFKLLSWSEL